MAVLASLIKADKSLGKSKVAVRASRVNTDDAPDVRVNLQDIHNTISAITDSVKKLWDIDISQANISDVDIEVDSNPRVELYHVGFFFRFGSVEDQTCNELVALSDNRKTCEPLEKELQFKALKNLRGNAPLLEPVSIKKVLVYGQRGDFFAVHLTFSASRF